MVDRSILWPMFTLVALTFIVSVAMFRRRIAEIRQRRLALRSIATSRGISILEDIAAADNFRNLLEMPVLFYAACLTIAVTETATPLLDALCWVYVALRVAHSTIQLTCNRVRHRFYAFAASTAVLLIIWVLAGFEVAIHAA